MIPNGNILKQLTKEEYKEIQQARDEQIVWARCGHDYSILEYLSPELRTKIEEINTSDIEREICDIADF